MTRNGLKVALIVLLAALSSNATETRVGGCATSIASQHSLRIPASVSPFAKSYLHWLENESRNRRFKDQWKARALEFAKEQNRAHRIYRMGKRSFIKCDPTEQELLVVVNGQVLFYDVIDTAEYGVENIEELFEALAKANLRGGEAIPSAAPFNPYNLRSHYRDHGHEFGAMSEEEYEALAIQFAEKPAQEGLIMDVSFEGNLRTLKIDFETGEMAVYAAPDQAVITFFIRDRHAFRYFLSKALPRKALR